MKLVKWVGHEEFKMCRIGAHIPYELTSSKFDNLLLNPSGGLIGVKLFFLSVYFLCFL